jgi:hypothetical protein
VHTVRIQSEHARRACDRQLQGGGSAKREALKHQLASCRMSHAARFPSAQQTECILNVTCARSQHGWQHRCLMPARTRSRVSSSAHNTAPATIADRHFCTDLHDVHLGVLSRGCCEEYVRTDPCTAGCRESCPTARAQAHSTTGHGTGTRHVAASLGWQLQALSYTPSCLASDDMTARAMAR